MNKKTIITRILIALTLIALIGSTIAYFILKDEKPWMAFYVACCGGVLVFNFLISLFLLSRNRK